jgi:hypothetical protein
MRKQARHPNSRRPAPKRSRESKVTAFEDDSDIPEGDFEIKIEAEDDDSSLLDKLEREATPWLEDNWRCSSRHMQILRILHKVRTFWDIVYYGRYPEGTTDAPRHDDGVNRIGESYRTAVNRFLSEGLIRPLQQAMDVIDLVLQMKLPSELEEIAEKLAITPIGTKREVAQRIIQSAGTTPFQDVLDENQLFIATEKAEPVLNDFERLSRQLEARTRESVFRAFCCEDFRAGLRLHRNCYRLTAGRWCMSPEICNPIVRVLSSRNNIFRLDDDAFRRLKAARSMNMLWKEENLLSRFDSKVELRSSGTPVSAEMVEKILDYNLDESEALENIEISQQTSTTTEDPSRE